MPRRGPSSSLARLAPLALAACAAPARPTAPTPAPTRAPAAMLTPVDRARWTPASLGRGEVIELLPDGTRRGMVGRARVEESPDGSLRVARRLLPFTKAATALPIPARLGGGYVFASPGSPSLVHHAPSFLGELTLVARAPSSPVTLVPARDRLLIATRDRVDAVDLATGRAVEPAPLPPFTRFAGGAYAPPNRALLLLDLWGLVETHDGGRSFSKVELPGARAVTADGDQLLAITPSGRFSVGPDGEPAPLGAVTAPHVEPRPLPPPPLGAPALRVAVESGWPLSDDALVVARRGWVAVVRASDGEVLAKTRALPDEEDATCHAVRFGADVGFVCGGEGRGTRVYGLVPPTSARLARSWPDARRVSPSGTGGLAVSGGCADGPARPDLVCVVSPDGAARDVRITGEVGASRVVALADGAAAVLVPPRGADDGSIAIVDRAGKVTSAPLSLPGHPTLRQGLWLEGVQEAGDGELAAWVEAGGTLVGVRVTKGGEVRDGAPRTEPLISVSGQVGVALDPRRGRALETRDGGLTWDAMELPDAGQGALSGKALRCGQAGCVVSFDHPWLRVGWGSARDPEELTAPEDRALPASKGLTRRPRGLRCELVSIDPEPRPVPAREAPHLRAFFGAAPPVIPAGTRALVEPSLGASAQLYAWAGAKAGGTRFVARFVDRFARERAVRSTAVTRAPWPDEPALLDALGREGSGLVLHGLADPGGAGVLFSACRSGRDACALFGASDGRSLTQRPLSEELELGRIIPPSASAVVLDDTWFLLVSRANELVVVRLDDAGARVLARLPRHGSAPLVRLTRRARSRALGLVVRGQGTFEQSDEDLLLFPIDPDTGAEGAPTRLGRADFGGAPPPVCREDDDGWLVEAPFGYGPSLAGATLGDVELRARVEPDRACTEALSARLRQPPSPALRAPGGAIAAWPLVALSSTGARLVASCR
ncbi:MAG: hypothetical protein IT374_23310 [Polyangiaceae bacterium]|nr:hypothetical protein [Polyangiaceae bacterium]